MARCYTDTMKGLKRKLQNNALPRLWLVSDARNDAVLEDALGVLPRGSGVIFRHYHLPPDQRRKRFQAVLNAARKHGHMVALAGTARQARNWGADAVYGSARTVARGPDLLRITTARSLCDLRKARGDLAMLSPVFATASHPDAKPIGAARFRLIAAQAALPVIALGGMTQRRAARVRAWGWAAIDGLSAPHRQRYSGFPSRSR